VCEQYIARNYDWERHNRRKRENIAKLEMTEMTMKPLMSRKTVVYLPLILLTAALATPTSAGWFSDPATGTRKNIGSAPSPTPQDIREYRKGRAMSAADKKPDGPKKTETEAGGDKEEG